jgi:hypothetical protein
VTIWTLIQIICDVTFMAGFAVVAIRLKRPPQDDPRLSRGLQLLQTKITILEDLSDRTDQQFKQLNGMLEQKTRQLQNKILEAEQEVLKIDHSMHKSMEVAEIFQDKIPHEEILERQRTIEYVKAAKMANSGMSVEDIIPHVNLPVDQVELIAKFNRDQLMFDETQLPDWALKPSLDVAPVNNASYGLGNVDFVNSLETTPTDLTHMQKVERDFRESVEAARAAAEAEEAAARATREAIHNAGAAMHSASTITGAAIQRATAPAVKGLRSTAETIKQKLVHTAEDLLSGTGATTGTIANDNSLSGSPAKKERMIKKVIFPRIEDADGQLKKYFHNLRIN